MTMKACAELPFDYLHRTETVHAVVVQPAVLFDKCRLLNHELDFNITTSAGLNFNSNVNIFCFLSLCSL